MVEVEVREEYGRVCLGRTLPSEVACGSPQSIRPGESNNCTQNQVVTFPSSFSGVEWRRLVRLRPASVQTRQVRVLR